MNKTDSPASLQGNIIYLCGEFSHQFHRALTQVFRQQRIKVTVEQFAVLVLLYYKKQLNQQEISSSLNRDKTTIARVISNMVARKLVRRVKDEKDGRIKMIALTRAGEVTQEKAVLASGELYLQATEGINYRELAIALKVMACMYGKIQ